MKIEERMLSIEKIFPISNKIFAHLSQTGEMETLAQHTKLCQSYWVNIVQEKHLDVVFEKFETLYFEGRLTPKAKEIFEDMLVNIITMHDIGKVNPKFQKDKMQQKIIDEYLPDTSIGSKHSIISSVFYLDYYYKRIAEITQSEQDISKSECDMLKDFAFVYAYIIAKHHSSLHDFESYVLSVEGKEIEGSNLGKKAKQWLDTWMLDLFSIENVNINRKWKNMHKRMQSRNDKIEKEIYFYGLVRLLYSLLVASDYYATTEFVSGWKCTDFGNLNLCNKIRMVYENTAISKSIRNYEKLSYPNLTGLEEATINELRTELFLDAERVLKDNLEKEIFYLEAPTGSGKSNTAFNLSFTLMQKEPVIHKLFYIYPFNTLVEQNMETMNKIFENEKDVMSQIAVVNSLTPMKRKSEEMDQWNQILLDRQFLNYPIVLSTHVTLFRTMFGNSREDLFAFHQLCNSVIVLDEIQSYNNDLWNVIILFFKYFAKLFHIKVIIMSATLPNLDFFTEDVSDTLYLISDRNKYFHHEKFAHRVVADYSLLNQKIELDILKNHVLQHENKKILMEFITKNSAREFYNAIKEESTVPVFLMTGESSLEERKLILQKVCSMDALILVATQVVEAGVDIDMDIGYKDISRFDSEEQFMGRINRSAKSDKKGVVYFFHWKDAARIYRNDLRVQKEKTLQNPKIREMLDAKDFPLFYQEEILPILKCQAEKLNKDNVEEFFSKKVGLLDFLSVSERMKLIKDTGFADFEKSVYFARVIKTSDGMLVDGASLWEEYKMLLQEATLINYEEHRVRLFDIRTKMNAFIYQFSENVIVEADEQIGDLYYVKDGDDYFDENGILMRSLFETQKELFF